MVTGLGEKDSVFMCWVLNNADSYTIIQHIQLDLCESWGNTPLSVEQEIVS